MEFNINDNFHRTICQTLGQLLGGVSKKTINKDTKNAKFFGREFGDDRGKIKKGGHFLKLDAMNPGGNKGSGRSKFRVIVLVDKHGKLVEDRAWLWNHADRPIELGKSFMTAGTTLSFRKLFS